MRPTNILLRGSKGYSWYKNYMEKGPEAFARNVPPTPFDWSANKTITRPKVYFDLGMDKENIGKITFELASDVVPMTVYNFIRLSMKQGKYCYLNTKLHRVHKKIAIMGGDVEMKGGAGNHSSFETRHFPDENYIIPHSHRGLISMASVGLDTNGSQFYISFGVNSHMNGRCMVFGHIVDGEEHLKTIESLFTFRGAPSSDVVITDCGVFDHEAFIKEIEASINQPKLVVASQ
jgi:cyclophilin family peptidyl-prolyl cis-trans isomerase